MSIIGYILGAVLLAAVGELVSAEIRARLDRIPLALLRAAARRLPPELREDLYERAWLPELIQVLRGDEAMPITRLAHGTRFAVRLWLSAPQIWRELDPGHAAGTLSRRAIRFVFAPSFIVAASMGTLQNLGGVIVYVIHYPSWLAGLITTAAIAIVCAWAVFGRRILIWRHGYVPGTAEICQCRLSIVCRSLVVPLGLTGACTLTILACRLASIGSAPVAYPAVAIGSLAAQELLLRRGFVKRVHSGDELDDLASTA